MKIFSEELVAEACRAQSVANLSTATIGETGAQSFNVGLDAYGEASDTFSGFMLATGSKIALVGFGTMGVTKRPARPKKNA